MNIYDFINDPSKAVYAGYRPSYLTCVSCVANNWWAFCRWTTGRVGRFKDVLDMTLGEIIEAIYTLVFGLAIVISFPVSVYPLALLQYLNVQRMIKNLEELDKLQ